MKQSTIYLDEVGSFQTDDFGSPKDPPWAVGGVIANSSKTQSDTCFDRHLHTVASVLTATDWYQQLANFVEPFTKRRGDRLNREERLATQIVKVRHNPQWLHRAAFTVWIQRFRAETGTSFFPQLEELDKQVLSIIESQPLVYRKLAVIHNEGISKVESINYSITLQEVLFTLLSEYSTSDRDIDPIFVVSTRNEDMQEHERRQLAIKLANSVATGISAIGGNMAGMDPADAVRFVTHGESSGLVLADFVCAQVRGAHFRSVSDITPHLISSGFLCSSTSVNIDLKVLRHARRRKDYPSAVLHGLIGRQETECELRDTLFEVLSQPTEPKVRHTFEAVIDRIDHWSQRQDKRIVLNLLIDLIVAVECAFQRHYVGSHENLHLLSIMFRLNAYALVWANHLGSKEAAGPIETRLLALRQKLGSHRSSWEAVCLFDVGCVERAINENRLEDAHLMAEAHLRYLIPQTSGPMNLAGDALDSLHSGHAFVRAYSLFLRAEALFRKPSETELSEVYSHCMQAIRELGMPDTVSSMYRDDLVRLLLTASFVAEKLGDCTKLTDVAAQLLILWVAHEHSSYLEVCLVRTASSLALLGSWESVEHLLRSSIDEIREGAQAHCRDGRAIAHPQEILLRELVILHGTTIPTEVEFLHSAVLGLDDWAESLDVQSEVHRHQLRLWSAVKSSTFCQKGTSWEPVVTLRRLCIN